MRECEILALKLHQDLYERGSKEKKGEATAP
jgi:hypothetical protein